MVRKYKICRLGNGLDNSFVAGAISVQRPFPAIFPASRDRRANGADQRVSGLALLPKPIVKAALERIVDARLGSKERRNVLARQFQSSARN
jgi:hypothetical protein